VSPRALLIAALAAAACNTSSFPGGPGDDDDGAPPPPPPPDAAPPEPDGPPPEPSVPPEIDGQIVINEVMTDNALTVKDETGAAGDWIELFNPTDQDIPLHGYSVTDDLAAPRKGFLHEGVMVPAHGYLVLWLDDEPERGPTHLGFKLTRAGGQVGLARPDGSYIDRIVYAAQAVDFSAAREPDHSDRWVIEWHPSPGAANPAGAGHPVGLEVPTAPPEQVPAAGDLTERILGYDVILELAIEVSPAGAASLERDPFTYVQGTLVYDGRRYGPVGVRLKGANSFMPFSQKPSFRINIDEYVSGAKFFGLDDLTLNNMKSDFSMMHERMAYYVARQTSVPASRANHALITVNGQFYGLYTNVETVKRPMLARWFRDAGGPLFEATDVDFAPQYVNAYELETGPNDRHLLSGAAQALTNASADQAIAAVSAYVDMESFWRFWAMESIIAQFDAFPYSDPGDDYFVYADPTLGRLTFVPWGMDETFYSGEVDVKLVSSILAKKCLASASCFQSYVDHVWQFLARAEQLNLLAERVRIMNQIRPYVAMDTRKPYTNAQVDDYQGQLYWFLSERRARLGQMLPPPSH